MLFDESRLEFLIKKSVREVLREQHESKTPPDQKEFLNQQEVCELLGISRSTLWRMIKNHDLKPIFLGAKKVFRKEDLLKLK